MSLQSRGPSKNSLYNWSSETPFSKRKSHYDLDELFKGALYLIKAPKLETAKTFGGHSEYRQSHHHSHKKLPPAQKRTLGAETKSDHPIYVVPENQSEALDSKRVDKLVNDVLTFLNTIRKSHGLNPLTLDASHNLAAKRHSIDIALTGNVSHTGSDGSTLRERMERERCIFRSASEVVLVGQRSPEDVQSFLSSSASLKRMMSKPDVSKTGVHVCSGSDGRLYWTIICSVSRSLTRLEICEQTATKESGVMELNKSVLLEWRSELLSLINKTRAGYALQPVRMSRTLTSIAKLHTQDRARAGKISHYGTDGSDPRRRVIRQGYEYSYISENVASGQESPSHVHNAFMKSPGHAKNVLSPRVVEVGLHFCLTTKGQLFCTQNFGKRRPSRANLDSYL